MPLVAFDTMIIDEFADIIVLHEDWADAMETMEPPPHDLPREQHAMYWLVTLAPAWPSCLYTFSNRLYEDVRAMPAYKARWASRLRGLALEIRQAHPKYAQVVDLSRRPGDRELQALGLHPGDSTHLADAIGLDAAYFLTVDKVILKRATAIENEWALRVRTPANFLLESVRAGAPWPTTAPWPWESARLSTYGSAANDEPGLEPE